MAVVAGNPGDLQPPPGEGARLAIGGYWPSISETDIQDIADEHRTAAKSFSDYAELLQQQIARSMEVLEGQGGNARIAQLTKMRDHAVESADHTASKVTTAESYKSTVIGFKTTLIGIGDAAQEDWEKARSSKRVFDPTPYQGEAATAYSNSLKDIAKAPPPIPMPEDAGADVVPADGEETGQRQRPSEEITETNSSDERPVEEETGQRQRPSEEITETNSSDERPVDDPAVPGAASEHRGGQRPVTDVTPAAEMPMSGGIPAAAPGGIGGGSSAGAGGASLGGLKSPAQMPSAGSLSSSLGGKSLSDAATAPAASVSDAFSSSSGGGGGPLSSAANSFQSGLASGMGSSGAVSPPLEKFAGGPQHPAAAPLSATGSPQGPVAAAQGGPVAPPGGGAPSGAGPMMAGGGAMAPMIPPSGAGAGAGGGALPPYVPPGTATGGPVPPAGPSTAAAAGSSTPGPVQQGASTPAGGGAPPVVAGSGAATAAGLTGDDPHPDLLLAQRVLDGLVRGTRATAETFNSGFVQWAVSVLRASSGAHVLIASSVGAGVYMPAGVCLPFPATIAPLDDVLPWGWGQRFLGWDKPVVLLAEHADEACARVAGLRRSALVTTDEQARRPAGWDEFVAVPLIRIVHSPGEAPVLDGGAYRHRLASLEHGSFVSPVERIMERGLGRDVAARITEAVAAAVAREVAAAPAGSRSLIDAYDSEHVLGRLQQGQSVDWDAHWQHLIERDGGAVLHPILAGGLLDLDDSEVSNHSRMVYMQYYRAGLIAEMLRCWRFDQPDLRDVAYCALAAGFGQLVGDEIQRSAATITGKSR